MNVMSAGLAILAEQPWPGNSSLTGIPIATGWHRAYTLLDPARISQQDQDVEKGFRLHSGYRCAAKMLESDKIPAKYFRQSPAF